MVIIPGVILGDRISFSPCKLQITSDFLLWLFNVFLGRGGGPVPIWADVEGCDESSCVVTNGSEIMLSAELPVSVGANALTTRLTANVGILNLKMTLPDSVINGCNAFEKGCPIKVGSAEVISTAFVVSAAISNINPVIEFSLTNELGETAMCVRTRIRLIGG